MLRTPLIVTALLGFLLVPTSGQAQDLSATDIIDALRTDLPGRGKRGMGVFGGDPTPPSINLRVQFDYNQATLTNEAQLTLDALGRALSSDVLQGQLFEIIGHTDASGSVEYNQTLSENRARAVVDWLVAEFSISPETLRASGQGESALMNVDDPENGENRRVEIRSVLPKE